MMGTRRSGDENGSSAGSAEDSAMRRKRTMKLRGRDGGIGLRRKSRLLRRRLRREIASGIVMGIAGNAGMRMKKAVRPRMCGIGDLGLKKRSARGREMRMLKTDVGDDENAYETVNGALRLRRRLMWLGDVNIRAASRRTVRRIC
jgi:hypothetical protein